MWGSGLYIYIYIHTILSNRSQYGGVNGCRSKQVNVSSGVPQGSVLGPLLLILNTSEHFLILENKLIGYADDCTLLPVVLSPGVRVSVAESLNCDLGKVVWPLGDEIECE